MILVASHMQLTITSTYCRRNKLQQPSSSFISSSTVHLNIVECNILYCVTITNMTRLLVSLQRRKQCQPPLAGAWRALMQVNNL